MSKERPTIDQCIKDCWTMQNACNLSGVAFSFAEMVNVARQDAWDACVPDSMSYLHPVIVCGMDKMMDLAHMPHCLGSFGDGSFVAMGWLRQAQDKPTGTDEYKRGLAETITKIRNAFYPPQEESDGETQEQTDPDAPDL